MNRQELFTEEQLDYLVELLNIGAGNATTALCSLLQCKVEMTLPGVEVLPAMRVAAALGDPASPAACVRMKMVGDLTGCLLFIVPDEQKRKLADLAERAAAGAGGENPDADQALGVLAEIANILAGVYLTAIHDFCGLTVCHSVPVPAVDMLQALLDEPLADLAREQQSMVLITNEFLIGQDRVKTFFLILPTKDALQALVDSMKAAGEMYGRE